MYTLGVVGQDNISLTQCRDLIFPLPTHAEQQAIVNRISEIMVMIDELENKITERKDQAGLPMQSVLRVAGLGSDQVNCLIEQIISIKKGLIPGLEPQF